MSEPNPAVPKGVCYVETKSLDGETNLKVRNVMPALLGKVTYALLCHHWNLVMHIHCKMQL